MGTFWVRWDAEGDTPPLDMGRGDGHPNYQLELCFAYNAFRGHLILGPPPVPWAFNAQGVPKAVPPFELL